MELSKRLKAIYDMVPQGGRLCDVGCDHGYLPIALVESGRIETAIACDINEGPLMRAKSNIEAAGLSERIETRQSDGLCEIKANEADIITICGMGGMLILSILEKSPLTAKSASYLVLSPQSDVDRVRKYLRENGYLITDEDMVLDDGKYYPVIKAKNLPETDDTIKTEADDKTNRINDLYGPVLIEKKHPVLLDFLEKERFRQERILENLPMDASHRKKEVEEKLFDIRFLLKTMI